MPSLRTRTVGGLTWTALGQLGGQVIQLVTAVFLARRLLPIHFGTAGLALAVTTPLAALAQLGMPAALIQRPDLTRAHYRAALLSTGATSSLLGLILLLAAGSAGRLFHNPLLPPVLRIYSILLVLGTVAAVQSALLGRFLDFRSQALAALASRMVGSGTTVVLACANQGVMSIAWGYVALTITNVALLYQPVRRNRRGLRDSGKSASPSRFFPMFRYGSGVLAANLLDQLSLGLDTMLIARLMGPVALGYYSFAAQLALFWGRSLSSVLHTVLFPALAQVNSDTGRLRQAYLKLFWALICFSLPAVAVAVLLVPWAVPRFFGGTWRPAIPLIQLLMVYALFLFIFDSLTVSLLKATGRAQALTIFSAIRVAGIALTVLLGSRLGLTGVTLALAVFAIVYCLATLFFVTKNLRLSLNDFFRALTVSPECTLQPTAPEVCVLTTVHSPDDARIYHKEVKTLRSAGYTVAFIAPNHRPQPGLARRLIGPCRGLIQALGTGARVFHLHDPELLPVGLVLKALGKAVIYDIHEDYPQQIKDKHYLPKWLKPIVSSGLALLEQLVVRLFDGTVVATDAIANRFPKERVTLVRSFPASETASLPPPAPRRSSDPFRLIHLAGTLTEQRGITKLVEALALLDDSFTLVLGGRFVSQSYEKKVRSLPGFTRVRPVGTVPHQAVYQLYASAHAGIVPSLPLKRHLTALPVKLFEFMAAGLPVIVPDFPLLHRIVAEWNCGICVNTLDPRAIADAIRFLAQNPDVAREFGANGRFAVQSRFNWSGEAAELLALYRRITRAAPCSVLKARFPTSHVL